MRNAHSASTPTRMSATPLDRRCENSIMVSICGAKGITSPLHVGQCAPHPAPDPVARTNAPHRITNTFQARTAQANLAKRLNAIMRLPFGAYFSLATIVQNPLVGEIGPL